MVLATSYMGSTVYADPYSNAQQKLNESTSKYKSAQEKVDEIQAQIRVLDTQISDLYVNIEDTNNKISAAEEQIKISQEGVQAAENKIKEEEELFNKRMRSMYINGMDSYVEVLLNSKGLGDFIARLENVTKIISYDKEITASLTEKKIALEQKKNVLEQEKVQLLALQEENKNKVAEIEVKKEEHSKVMEVAAASRDEFKTAMNEDQDEVDSLRYSRGGDDSNWNSSGTVVSGDVAAILGTAYSLQGSPYVWGGNGPNVFDCSGYTRYVFRQHGVSLPRTAASQMGVGTSVSRSQLQPGDLVFFSYGSGSIDHVGIYVGNNSYIHAPQSGDVVKVSVIRSGYVGARRIVN
jgi:cell wall-associated NlpC family hydrolase